MVWKSLAMCGASTTWTKSTGGPQPSTRKTIGDYMFSRTRLKTGLGRSTPTVDLVKAAGDLSVQQLICFHTIMTVFRALSSCKPKYISDRMKLRRPGENDGGMFPLRQLNTIEVNEAFRSFSTFLLNILSIFFGTFTETFGKYGKLSRNFYWKLSRNLNFWKLAVTSHSDPPLYNI